MKTTFLKSTMVVLMVLSSIHAKADGVLVNGIYYKLNTSVKTAQVTSGNESSYADFLSNTPYKGDITIPSSFKYGGVTYSVTGIDEYAFIWHTSGPNKTLTSVTLPQSIQSIGNYAFYMCYDLETVNIPNSVTAIGKCAFYGCKSLNTITIPNNVTVIDTNAFGECSGLTSLTIPNSVTSIGKGAFSGCISLSSVTLSNNITTIGDFVFSRCNALTSVIIPSMVTSIGEHAFGQCSSLSSIFIPSSVTSIESTAFYKCESLTNMIVSTLNPTYDSRESCNAIIETSSNTLISGCKNTTIPQSVTCIGRYAFYGCNFSSVTLPHGVTSIGYGAFQFCEDLTSLRIPKSVTNIGVYAFWSCYTLTSVISEIEEPFKFGLDAFLSISSTCTLTVPYGTKDSYIAAGWTEDIFKGGIVEAEPVSPNITFADDNVKAICVANWDTNGDEELSEAEAAAVTDLGTVFKNNKQITSFDELQYFTGLTSIGTGAFYLCNGLRSVIIPNNVTSINQYGFCDCSSLTSVTFSNNVTSIGDRAFENCSGLTTISIPNSVTSIGYAAFSGCSSLTTVSIPNNVTSIVTETFDGCSGLTSVSIPNGVTSIGNSAFRDCSGLTSVTIPNSVTSIIGSYAFKNCTNLTSVISEIEEPSDFNIYAFQNISSTCTLTVPYGTKDAYFDKGWLESVFKGGIVELDNRNEQSMELTTLPAKTYGDASYTLPATTTEGLALTWSSGNTNVATISGNTLTVKGAGTATITASQVGNEEYKPFSKEFALTVAKAPLTITAQDFTRYEGEENPAFTVSYEGFVKNEDATVLTAQPVIATTAMMESAAGTYPITVSGATAANYEITFVAGTLTVQDKTAQTIALTSLPDMTYCGDAYTLPAQTEEGFDLTWVSSNTGVATISGNTLTVKGAGTAAITASQAGNEEYKPFSKEFTLTVAKAPLTITVNDAAKNVGDVNPAFTASYEGFVGDDDASVLTAQPTFTTEADENSPVGTYAIVVSGAEAANYEINYVNGTLTVVDEWSMSNTISLTDTQVLRGRQVVLPVSMNNTEDITALQFDLTLPAGVSIAVNSKGKYIVAKTERCADHTLSTSKPGEENVYKVLLYSTEVESITGNEGAVIHVTIEAAEDMEAGDYEVKLSNINLTTTAEKKITPADVTCVLTVRNSIPGDANGDGEIDVTDIVGIANKILGRASDSFVAAAADVNGDGEVDVTDIVAVANIILRGGGKANSAKVREAFQMLDPH